MTESSQKKKKKKGLKTLWDKEKLLVTSNFSFSHSVFKRLLWQTSKNQGLFCKELSTSKTNTVAKSLTSYPGVPVALDQLGFSWGSY